MKTYKEFVTEIVSTINLSGKAREKAQELLASGNAKAFWDLYRQANKIEHEKDIKKHPVKWHSTNKLNNFSDHENV